MVIQYFTECLQKNFHQASDFIFWEFSILGIFPSVEKSFNFFFLLLITGIILWLYYVESWMIGIKKIYPHSNHHYASVFLPFWSSLQFEIVSLLHKFSTVDTLFSMPLPKQNFWPQFPWFTEKSSIFIALFLNLFTQASPYLMMPEELPLFCASWNNQLWL